MSTDLRHGRHCVFNLHVHLVFVTKYRKQIFTKEHIEYLQGIFNKVCLDFDAQLVNMLFPILGLSFIIILSNFIRIY
jgi:putative transposase